MDKLVFADGTELHDCYAAEVRGNLYLYFRDTEHNSMMDIFPVVCDVKKTAAIRMIRGKTETVYSGYTKLFAVRDEGSGLTTASLTRE